MSPEEIHKQLKEADMEKLDQLMKMYDRILLYNLAANVMPQPILHDTIKLWDKVVKKTINEDASKRTDLLESSIVGRRAKYAKMPDGEMVRLEALKQWSIARNVILANLQKPDIPEQSDSFDIG